MSRSSARLKLVVSYDGTTFAGWQSQANRNGIQDHLEGALQKLCGEKVRVHGAGRTDAGVHALAQCAHADVPAGKYLPPRWASALNGLLPAQIRIEECRVARAKFHARFDAVGKIYRYRIWNAEVLSPLELNRAAHVRAPLDDSTMRDAARLFIGRHDFRGFAANRGEVVSDTIREIETVKLQRRGALLQIEVTGSGFLYKMVRLMVGGLLRCGAGKEPADSIAQRLKTPAAVHRRDVAPACGLYLVRVRYR